MTAPKKKILVYGYGNPGRQDDALGVMVTELIESWATEQGFEHIHTDSNYQLNLEDAAEISNYDLIIFADASHEDIEDFLFVPLKPSATVEFTMHSVAPEFILHLCTQLFEHLPAAYLLHIKGYEWNFMKELSIRANKNLEQATQFLQNYLLKES